MRGRSFEQYGAILSRVVSPPLPVLGTCPQLDNAIFAHFAPLEILVLRPPSARYLLMIRHHQPAGHGHRNGERRHAARLPYLLILLRNIAGHKFTAFEEETLYDRRVECLATRRVDETLRMRALV